MSDALLKGRQILIADDDPDVRDLVELILKNSGAEVKAVSNGQDAVRESARGTFEICILDVGMPKVNGIDACRQIRQTPHTATLPIMVLTGSSEASIVDQALGAGASDFLAKPVNAKLLVLRVSLLLQLSALSSKVAEMNNGLRAKS